MAGRMVRQGRLLAWLFLTAAMLTPGVSRAQDVIVLPPTTGTTASAPTPIPVVAVPDAASTDTVPSALPTQQTFVPTMLPSAAPAAQAVVATVKLDPNYRQCTTDADCVLASDGCGATEAVGKAYVTNWQAAMPHAATCGNQAFDLAHAQLVYQPVCREKTCGLVRIKSK